jgi:outer membrane protein assembly factor BamA
MWAGGPLGADVDVYSVEAQASTFWTVWFDHVFNIRAWTAVSEAHGDADDVPIFERQFLGGAAGVALGVIGEVVTHHALQAAP